MNQFSDYPLRSKNSFNVESFSEQLYEPENIAELIELADKLPKKFYILGDGSNTLFIDKNISVIIKPSFFGRYIEELDDYYQVCASATENWHDLVCYCIDNGINGLENLALIPGSVGAAPVQNIGAYGVEFSKFCHKVKWFDFKQKKIIEMDAKSCQFSYRDSVFKTLLKGKGLILEVVMRFPKKWTPALSYIGLDTLDKNAKAREVMEKVIEIRQSKLPDPKVLPNAGSFFKNPIVPNNILTKLQVSFPEIPAYKVDEHSVKLAAGWLIEKTGLKGYQIRGVGVHEHQALVLVNHTSNSGQDVLFLARFIVNQVKAKFDITLEPEVRLVGANGELSLSEIE